MARRGVVTAVASNNILNPFTPYGDASLLRMANLYANVAQLSGDGDLACVFDMVSGAAARLMGARYGIAVGAPADIVLLDCAAPGQAVREISQVLRGWKRGRRTFEHARPIIYR